MTDKEVDLISFQSTIDDLLSLPPDNNLTTINVTSSVNSSNGNDLSNSATVATDSSNNDDDACCNRPSPGRFSKSIARKLLFRYDAACIRRNTKIGWDDFIAYRNARSLVSYRWMVPAGHNHRSALMIIPGVAPLIHEDIGMIEELPCDQQLPSNDANHHPRYPVEPALRAIDLFYKHRFEYCNYDIMIDDHILVLLYDYCEQQLQIGECLFHSQLFICTDHCVRIDVQRIDRLVVFFDSTGRDIFDDVLALNYNDDNDQEEFQPKIDDQFSSFHRLSSTTFGDFCLIVNGTYTCIGPSYADSRSTIKSDMNEIRNYQRNSGDLGERSYFPDDSTLGYLTTIAMPDRPIYRSKLQSNRTLATHWSRVLLSSAKQLDFEAVDECDTVCLRTRYRLCTKLHAPSETTFRTKLNLETLQKTHFLLEKIVNLVRYFPDDKVYNIFVEKGKPLLMFERGDAVYPQAIPESYRQKLLIE